MSDALLIGITIGYFVFVLSEELHLPICRLCVVWWASLITILILWDPWTIGLVNVAAHASYVALVKLTTKEEEHDS